MPNTRDITNVSSNILLIGDSGTHKTHFLGGLPDNFIFDFDKGLSILRDVSVEYETYKEAPKGTKVGPLLKKEGLYEYATAWDAFTKHLNTFAEKYEKGEPLPKNISLDSLTFLGEIAMNKILKETNQEFPHQGSYGAQQVYLKKVLGQLTTWPTRLVCTAHIQRDENLNTGVTEKLPLITGKLAGFISAFFDEVYFCESKVDSNGKQQFFIKTRATPNMRQAKSRWGVPDDTELSWKALEPYFQGTPPPEPKPTSK